jgi:hypothetical protein
MKNKLTIADMMLNPKLLGASFDGPSWHRWLSTLKAAYAEPMDDDDLAAFREVAEREPPSQRVKEFVAIVGRGGGKDSVASLIAVHAAASFDPRGKLRPGEKAVVMCLACDRHQAAIVFNYIKAAFEETPALKKMLVNITADSIELTNRVVCEVHTNSFRSVRGRSLLCCIFDEAAHWRDDASANPDTEMHGAVTPGLARVPNSMLVLISTAHKRSGLLWNRFKEHYGKEDSNTLVVKGSTTQFNPLFDAAIVDAALQSDPQLYGAEYNSEWRSDLQAFVSREAVEACVVEGRFELAPIPGVSYQAFVDPSGGASDSMTLAIGHKQDNRVIIDLVREWQPPFSPESVVDEAAQVLKLYGIRRVIGDRFGGVWVQEPFIRRGITYKLSEFEKNRLYQAFLPLVNSTRVELLDLPKLKSQIIALERRTQRGGRDSIDHPKGAHDDLANVCAGVAQITMGPIPNQPAVTLIGGRQFRGWHPDGRPKFDENKSSTLEDGPITEGPYAGGYAGTRR